MEKLKLKSLETEFSNGSGLNGPCPLPEPGDKGTEIFGNPNLISIEQQPIVTKNSRAVYQYDNRTQNEEDKRFTRGLIYDVVTGKIEITEAGRILKKLKK